MKPGHFLLNGQDSEDYGVFIQDRPTIETPRRKVEFKSSYGKSGADPFDEEAYENTDLPLTLYVEGKSDRTASDNRDRIHTLFDSGQYMDFIPYFDTNKIYKVMTIMFPSFDNKYYFGEGMVIRATFTVKPYKYYVDSPKSTLTAGGSIQNTTSKTSLPRIKIFGSGDVTLSINEVPFVIKNITGDIILDSELMIAYREVNGLITNENDKVYTRVYPIFKVGTNTISWTTTGTVTKIEVEPRWRTLA